jgi:hypothetical protein
MDLWIQPCVPCAELYGQPSTVEPHGALTLSGAGAVKDAQVDSMRRDVRSHPCG